jgi:protoporphyrinogen/coproporphyrinogen III oxidase
MTCDVVVIGAGVSGLATANHLMARGFDVRVLERQVRVGGNATTERFGGFLMEQGPTTLNAAYPKAMESINALGLDGAAIELGEGVRKRYLRNGRSLHGINVSRMGFLLSGYLSPGARLSLAAEIFRRRKRDDGEESIHAFVSRRFGTEFADKVIEPLAAGIFMGDSKELSIWGAFPKLVEMEQRFGSILRAVLAARRGSEPGRRLFSWPDGVATLPNALAARLDGRVLTGVSVTGLRRSPGGFTIQTSKHGGLHTRSVVLAVQPHVAASLLERLDPTGAAALADIQAPPVAVTYLGYRRDQVGHPLDGLGYLSTKSADQIISGAQFASTMFTGRAPAGHVAISAYVGGARNPDAARLPGKELAALVHAELAEILGIHGSPVVTRTRSWPCGLPHYTLGHTERRSAIETATTRVPGLYVTGNFLGGVSVPGCLEQARETAERLCLQLPKADLRISTA